MRELIGVFRKDIMREKFTSREIVVYGVEAPLVLIVFCMIADYISNY